MTKGQLEKAITLARSKEDIFEEIDIFTGYGSHDFKPVYTTIRAVANLIRWQCVTLNDGIDQEELDDLCRTARTKFMVVGQ